VTLWVAGGPVEWSPGTLELRACGVRELLDQALRRAGMGRLEPDLGSAEGEWPASLSGACHHIGTTRMHSDPRQGVTDGDGRVHGIANLYITGSSVFPTAGHANPTLTIVALALRLGRRWREALRRGAFAPYLFLMAISSVNLPPARSSVPSADRSSPLESKLRRRRGVPASPPHSFAERAG
jgi:hypothetical protein